MEMITPPERPMSPPRRQRACLACTKAKARCHFPEDTENSSSACERCERIGIRCVAKSSKSLRKPRQIKPLNNRVSSLEQKLDELTRALHSRESDITRLITSQTNAETVADAQKPKPAVSTVHNLCSPDIRDRPAKPRTIVPNSSTPPFGLTWYQADTILQIYRTEFCKNFPFVIISESVSAKELLKSKPAVFRAIMLACAPLPTAKLEKMKRNALAYLSQHIIVEDDRDIELLQALLIVLAWADLGGLYDQQITNLTFMAVGYAHNLGITKIPRAMLRKMGIDDIPEDLKSSKTAEMMSKVHSPDEQRTFLGCYCLASVNSTQFGRLNSLSGQYVELCCETLERNREFETDFIVTQMVRMIHVGERIAESFGAAVDNTRGRPFLFLLGDHVSAMRTELDSIMASLSEKNIKENMPSLSQEDVWEFHITYALHYQYLLVRLYEPATYLKPSADEPSNPPSYRVQGLQNCLNAIKDYYNIIERLSGTFLRCMPVTQIAQVTLVLVISTRLLLIDGGPNYDILAARKLLNFEYTLDDLIVRLRAVEKDRLRVLEDFARNAGLPLVPEDDSGVTSKFLDTAMKTGWIKNWYIGKIAEKSVGPNSVGAANPSFDWNSVGSEEMGTEGKPPVWFGGLLENNLWNFDDMDMPQ